MCVCMYVPTRRSSDLRPQTCVWSTESERTDSSGHLWSFRKREIGIAGFIEQRVLWGEGTSWSLRKRKYVQYLYIPIYICMCGPNSTCCMGQSADLTGTPPYYYYCQDSHDNNNINIVPSPSLISSVRFPAGTSVGKS